MAPGTSAAEEEPIERERHRWSENRKVYTRKIHKLKNSSSNNNNTTNTTNTTTTNKETPSKSSNNNNNENPGKSGNNDNNNDTPTKSSNNNNNNNHPNLSTAAPSVSATATADNQTNENINSKDNSSSSNNDNKNRDHIANGSTAKENEKEVSQKKSSSSPAAVPVEEVHSSPAAVPVEEANSSQPQLLSTHVESASEDSSILNRIEPPVPNGHDANLVNGSVKPVVTLVDDRVNISVSAASSKEAVRELKRKLVDELSQVRKMAKRLEDKEIQISGFSSSRIDVGVGRVDSGIIAPALTSLQFPVNGAVEKGSGGSGRINTDVCSNGSRFRQLSVSVMEINHGVSEVMEKEKRTPKANQYYRNSEFLLGKERLPPAETNKKSKSSSKKHRSREIDYGFGIDKQLYKKCSSLLQKLMRHKLGWVFNQPVDVKKLGLHDYFDIIKHPMDLGTVKMRLTKNWYKTPREFAEDVRLTFHNAMTYNPEGQDVHFMAKELLGIFEERWPAIETEYDRKLRYEVIHDLGVPTPTSRKTSASAHAYAPLPLSPPPILHHPPPFQEIRHLGRSQSMPVAPEPRSMPAYLAGRTPAPKKPKAKDPHKRDMTFEEKQRLSTNLQSLPAEKLDAVVQIIKKRNTALSQHDDEIEVDIDSVDNETLWELDRFVTNYKKNLSKHKRKAERALQARAQAMQTAHESIPAPVNVEAAKETREGEVNVATSPHVRQERHSENAGGSSSSSSSSSDSGSSSSDSDSSSSSSSGSDGGQ
ncbi:hypothetical protein Cgig2_030638 [Carnegiea gigantea]|uniref:Transcription factor GTE4 n=1 Tax=Carnegiea gigantea TaxID=171969 RepID=A0A9Q1K8F5_9CARY|nr:hypothetical protein Cgig2_030638 [Carnegiea gigantea]